MEDIVKGDEESLNGDWWPILEKKSSGQTLGRLVACQDGPSGR